MRIILSLIGTSLLTNQADNNLRTELNRNANLLENEMPESLMIKLSWLKQEISDLIKKADQEKLKKLSAELNSITSFYEIHSPTKDDIHILIATDTYLAKFACEIIQEYLNSKGYTCWHYCAPGLNTKSKKDFDEGIKALLLYLDETIPEYKQRRYEIVFNLTGGFKSLQGFLNTIGTFYADRIIYIFETGGLIEIPKLPISIDQDLFRNYAKEFLLLSKDHFLKKEDVKNIPETLLYEVGSGVYGLSNWGVLMWNNVKTTILSQNLINLPAIEFDSRFIRDFKNEDSSKAKIKLNETIAKAAVIFMEKGIAGLKADGGLQYEDYQNTNIESLPLGHFRVTQSLRITCVYLEDRQKLVLRFYGSHEHIRNNEKV
ncbi:MAG TPA: putative CRISPR-associated protein [Bacteroidales bacterium]|nr:putative CRISPR-associated protein [Bacteroidales bacterium]